MTAKFINIFSVLCNDKVASKLSPCPWQKTCSQYFLFYLYRAMSQSKKYEEPTEEDKKLLDMDVDGGGVAPAENEEPRKKQPPTPHHRDNRPRSRSRSPTGDSGQSAENNNNNK